MLTAGTVPCRLYNRIRQRRTDNRLTDETGGCSSGQRLIMLNNKEAPYVTLKQNVMWSAIMSVYLQLERSADGFVESLAPVIFDYTAISSDDISYDSDTGEITVNKRGVYQISWSVVSQSSQNSTVSFDLRTDEGANNIEGSPSKTGQVSGVATISVELPPTKFELVNTGVDRVYFSPNVATKARLSVIEASPQSDTTIPFASADPIEISADVNGQPEYMFHRFRQQGERHPL